MLEFHVLIDKQNLNTCKSYLGLWFKLADLPLSLGRDLSALAELLIIY